MKPMIFDYKIDTEKQEVMLLLSMSSATTLKPALLFEGFFKSLDREFSVSMLSLHRIDIYKLVEKDNEKYIEPFIVTDNSERFYLNG